MSPWYLWASKMSTKCSWKITRYIWQHNCGKIFKHKHATFRWVSRKYGSKMKGKVCAKDLRQQMRDDLGTEVSATQCKKEKNLSIEYKGSFTSQFNMIDDYSTEILRSNPGATVKLMCDRIGGENGPRTFKRYYICLQALKNGFQHRRHIIGLDDCFLKGSTKGQLLVTIRKDVNNGMYPIAWAMVEVENIESWQFCFSTKR